MSSTFNNPPDSERDRDTSFLRESADVHSKADLKRRMDSVWKQSIPIFLDRLNRLDAFVLAVEAGTYTPQQHEDATTIAHTFAGSLGMFGYPEGTDLARSMEQWLEVTPSPNAATLREYVAGLHTVLGL